MPGSDQPALPNGPSSSDKKVTASLPAAIIASPDRRSGLAATPTSQPLSFSPATTRPLPFQNQPSTTRILTTVKLPSIPENTSQRIPVVIKGELKRKPAPAELPHTIHRKRRLVVSLLGVLILFLITGLTLLSVSPLGHEIGLNFNPLQAGSNLFNNQNSGLSSFVAQATATAIYHRQIDGYDPYAYGVQTITNGENSLDWPTGQCTSWANYRYHQLTGFWVAWNGNADQWVAGAQAAGWNVSQTPHVPSIIVLMPYIQGASGYGHVAVVESIVLNSSPTTVDTSDMNWWANGGGWDKVSDVDFTAGSGVYFIWHS